MARIHGFLYNKNNYTTMNNTDTIRNSATLLSRDYIIIFFKIFSHKVAVYLQTCYRNIKTTMN